MMSVFGEFWTMIISTLSVFATGFVGWFFGRRKTQAEVRSAEIDNDVKLSKHYAKLLDDLERRYTEKLVSVEQLYNQKEKALRDEIRILKRRIRLLENENKDLRKRNNALEKSLNELS